MLKINTTLRSLFATKQLFGFPKSRYICSKSCKSVCPPLCEMTVALSDDHNNVLNFLRQHFYNDEPLRVGAPPHAPDPVDEKFHLDSISRGTCILAVEPNDNIIGVLIALVKTPSQLANLAESNVGKWGKILTLWAKADEESKIFRRFNATRSLHAYILAVHREYRGYGFATRMMEELMMVGRRKKFDLVSIDATNVHVACICQRLGMNLVNTIAYRNYMDDGGHVIFQPPRPHDAIRTYVKRI